MNIDASNALCFDASMFATSIEDMLKGMKLVEAEGKKIEEQKAKSQVINLSVSEEEEFRDEKRLLDIKA